MDESGTPNREAALILRLIDSLCFVESSISHQGEGTKGEKEAFILEI